MNGKFIFLVFILGWQGPIEASDPLVSILEKHAHTIGSLDRWRSIETAIYLLEIKEPKFQLRGVYRIKRNSKMRIDIFAERRHVFTEAFNGSKAWQWHDGDAAARPVNDKGTSALSHGIELPGHLYTLLDMRPRGNTLEYVGTEERLNTAGHLLKLTLKDGHEKFYFLDAKTGVLLASRDHRAFHPDIDNTQVLIETRLQDFRDFQGVVKSFRLVNWDLTNDTWLGTTQILSLTYDQAIDDGYFEAEHLKTIPLDKR